MYLISSDLVCFGSRDEKDCLFAHQTQMLRVALTRGKAVITAGTGSGKTESFLLPILATLLRNLVLGASRYKNTQWRIAGGSLATKRGARRK